MLESIGGLNERIGIIGQIWFKARVRRERKDRQGCVRAMVAGWLLMSQLTATQQRQQPQIIYQDHVPWTTLSANNTPMPNPSLSTLPYPKAPDLFSGCTRGELLNTQDLGFHALRLGLQVVKSGVSMKTRGCAPVI